MPSTPLFAPRRFFAQRTPSLFGAAVILYLTGVVSVASGIPFVTQTNGFSFSIGAMLVALLLGGAFGAAGIWVVSTVLVYLLSQAAGGSGSVARTAANVGWAAFPLLVVNSLSTATVLVLFFTDRLPAITVPGAMPTWLVVLNALTGLAGYLWIGHLLTYAISDARDLDVRRARVVAGLVIAIPILYSVSLLL
ncbi:YIP1 family protein [Salinigranum sp. GCM10025319]|uniref:YIP1 family protein n=1 Tax=Salinigranum sp. GCM10025319 TaxID=3252687 RepID=UPI00360B3BF2